MPLESPVKRALAFVAAAILAPRLAGAMIPQLPFPAPLDSLTCLSANPQKGGLSIVHSNGNSAAGATLGRDPATGYVLTNTLHHVDATETYSLNGEGWILGETRGTTTATYTYRNDGARTSYARDGRTAQYVVSAAGAVEEIRNAFIGEKLRAPLESASVRYVGTAAGDFASVEAALTDLVETVGSSTFTAPEVIVIRGNSYSSAIAIGADFQNLHPTAAAPLIIRGGVDRRVTLQGQITVTHVNHVRLQGFRLAQHSGATVSFSAVTGPVLTSCVVLAPVEADHCPDIRVIGNTFDGASAIGSLSLTACTSALLRNNIYLNSGSTAGVSWDTTPDSGHNCYCPSNSVVPVEASSLYVAPGLTDNGLYEVAAYDSPVCGAGEPQEGYNADVRGWYRHLAHPSMGAVEYGLETMTRDAGGRITRREVAGRSYDYAYDARGMLTGYTNSVDPTRSATYAYDGFGNRILMTVGPGTANAVTTRFVYQGRDVVAEYVTEPGGTSIARKRVYWLRPELDQRIGFVDIVGESRTVYYYLCDAAGSVQRVVRADGTVVNQYDYDAFGNLRPENTYEGIANRYTFHGREWDAHAGHYQYRFRTYIPEWGSFSGPDMNLALGVLGEPNGVGSYVFCRNDPVSFNDPMGLNPLANPSVAAQWGEGAKGAEPVTFSSLREDLSAYNEQQRQRRTGEAGWGVGGAQEFSLNCAEMPLTIPLDLVLIPLERLLSEKPNIGSFQNVPVVGPIVGGFSRSLGTVSSGERNVHTWCDLLGNTCGLFLLRYGGSLGRVDGGYIATPAEPATGKIGRQPAPSCPTELGARLAAEKIARGTVDLGDLKHFVWKAPGGRYMDLLLDAEVLDGRLIIRDAHIMPVEGTFNVSRNLLGRPGLQELARDLADQWGVRVIDIPGRIGRGSSGAIGSFGHIRVVIDDAGNAKLVRLD